MLLKVFVTKRCSFWMPTRYSGVRNPRNCFSSLVSNEGMFWVYLYSYFSHLYSKCSKSDILIPHDLTPVKLTEWYFSTNVTVLSYSLYDESKDLYWNHSCNLATHLVWPLNSRQSIKPEKLTGSDYSHHHTDLSWELNLPQAQARQEVQGCQLLLVHPVKDITSYKL